MRTPQAHGLVRARVPGIDRKLNDRTRARRLPVRYCTPGQICSAVAVLDEIEAGAPSHVTGDLGSGGGIGGAPSERCGGAFTLFVDISPKTECK